MKRYTTREAIIKDIDTAHRKIAKAKVVMQEHFDMEELLRGCGANAEQRAATEAADKQMRKIKRLETVRLPYLGAKLAEFDTIPLALSHTAPETTSELSSAPQVSSGV